MKKLKSSSTDEIVNLTNIQEIINSEVKQHSAFNEDPSRYYEAKQYSRDELKLKDMISANLEATGLVDQRDQIDVNAEQLSTMEFSTKKFIKGIPDKPLEKQHLK